jgi:hypothetical protein
MARWRSRARRPARATFFGAYAQWAATSPPAWDDVAWLARLLDGPFLVKGITRVDDAQRAVDAEATAISVSNHGGKDLDGTRICLEQLRKTTTYRCPDRVPSGTGWPGRSQRRRAEGASRPRARARSTASPRRCVPSLA